MSTMTLGALLDRLTALADEHGRETPVFIHDADTDWSMKMDEGEAVRFGKNSFGEGVDGAVMIMGVGYGGIVE